MQNLIPCKFRFDAILEYHIPIDLLDFYLELSKEIFAIDFILPTHKSFKSISVEEGEVNFKPSAVSDLLAEKLKTDYEEFGVTSENNTFLIDLSKSGKGSKLLYPLLGNLLIPYLQEFSNGKSEFNQPLFFIILETLYSGEKTLKGVDENGNTFSETIFTPESYYTLLEEFILNGSACIMGLNNNQGIYSWKENSFQKIPNFSAKTIKLKKDALELMRYKLIKKVGHFVSKHNTCQQFFYTGEFCKDEIFELLNEYILESFKEKIFNPKYIVFHCPQSPWLKESIIRSSNELLRLKTKKKYCELNIESCFDINDVPKDKTQEDKINLNECEILFVVDFIHTGTEFKTVYSERVRPYFPKASIKGLTLLCTDSAIKKSKSQGDAKTITVHISDEAIDIPIKYFQNVEHKVYDKENEIDKCPMCKYDLLPPIESNFDGDLKLTSYEMWLIANSAGYDEEHVMSTAKRDLHWLPDTMKIIEQYGPYLAFKFHQNLIKSFPNQADRPKVIVFPDETTNIYYQSKLGKQRVDLKDTPSGFYAKCLEELLKIEIFGVPREIIHALKGEGKWVNKQIKLEDIPEKFPEVHQQLERLPNHFIVIDEFYFTGNSFEMLLAILKKSGKAPKCFFPILNYGLTTMNEKIKNGEYNSFKTLSLYEFNVY